MIHNAPHRRRGGFSLVELLAVMIAGSMLISVAISVLAAIQRADRRFAQLVDERRSAAPLSDRLRADLHASQAIAWHAADASLVLSLPTGARVIYQRLPGRWERSTRGTADAPPQLAGAYPSPGQPAVTVSPEEATTGELIRISWVGAPRRPGERRPPPREETIVATVGRDLVPLHR
jgi:type II secretory pathway pseudopilin PulG